MNMFISPPPFTLSIKQGRKQYIKFLIFFYILMYLLTFFPQSLGWKACPQSIPTVSYVSRCPANAEEWKSAAARKDCRALGMKQNCSDDGSFAYHCVLNEDGTKLMEVCAPVWDMSGSYSISILIFQWFIWIMKMKMKFVLNYFGYTVWNLLERNSLVCHIHIKFHRWLHAW